MKNVTKKTLSLMLAMVSGFSVLSMAACQPQNPNSGDNPNKKPDNLNNVSTIQVAVFNGGFGYEWAEQVAADFAEDYKDYSFEEGKKGVYVEVLKSKTLYNGSTMISRIENKLEKVDVYYTADEVKSVGNVAADITDIVTEKVYDADGNLAEEGKGVKSIIDMLDKHYVNQYNRGTNEKPKYQYLPYEDCLTGFIYDYELFAENGWLNYSGLDGTPKYTDEFLDLCDRIVEAGYIPWTTSMDTGWYPDNLYQGYVMQYEGEKDALLNLTLEGEYTFPAGTLSDEIVAEEGVTVNADGTQTVMITPENAWLLVYQPGKKKMIEFCYDVTRPEYLSTNVTGATNSFTECQKNFIMSWGYDKGGMQGGKRIAMIYEGEWWEHEAKSSFEDLNRRYPGRNLGYGQRDLRMMPYPQERDGANEYDYSMYIQDASAEFVSVNSDPAKREIVKKWVQYTKSKEALKTHAQYTSLVLPYDYTLDESDMSSWTKFAKSIYKLKREQAHIYRADITDNYTHPCNKVSSSLFMTGIGWPTIWREGSSNQASYFAKFIKNPNLTATSVYNSMFKIYNKSTWAPVYQLYADRFLNN